MPTGGTWDLSQRQFSIHSISAVLAILFCASILLWSQVLFKSCEETKFIVKNLVWAMARSCDKHLQLKSQWRRLLHASQLHTVYTPSRVFATHTKAACILYHGYRCPIQQSGRWMSRLTSERVLVVTVASDHIQISLSTFLHSAQSFSWPYLCCRLLGWLFELGLALAKSCEHSYILELGFIRVAVSSGLMLGSFRSNIPTMWWFVVWCAIS